jgi:hypothetical protein
MEFQPAIPIWLRPNPSQASAIIARLRRFCLLAKRIP